MEMASFLFGVATFVLIMVALGLVRILRGPDDVDRILSMQLLGTGGVAVLVLLAVATKTSPILDVALMLELLAVFVSVGFLRDASGSEPEPPSVAGH
jgi:multicomponent Na+:H+ antiporter subunit F